ncbi:MAG: hypothetical protein HKN16_05850 [Saprospiraceae bacterium]|nr:hypothetical protein [Saprospiraceae bacterium]
MSIFKRGIYFVFGFLIFQACAQIVPPSGGDPDEEPPKLDSLNSTENFQTGFTKQRVELIFNEWIELKDTRNQLVVSPFTEDYTVSLKKKTVIFEFGEEPLKENITYIINFGESVVDFTAGNSVPNLRMVFSTGDFIDSLNISGKVIDAYSGEPVEKALILVHEDLSDTTVFKNKPLYLARTDAEGLFSIENMKADTFQVFALVETRNNYLYEEIGEAFAFLDSFLILPDTMNTQLEFRISKSEKTQLRILDKELGEYGKIKLAFNTPPEDVSVSYSDGPQRFSSIVEKDSLLIWYHNPDTSAFQIFVERDSLFRDTLSIKGGLDPEESDLNLASKLGDKKEIDLISTDDLELSFTQSLHKFETDLITLRVDSLETKLDFEMSFGENSRSLKLNHPWAGGQSYRLQLAPGSLESIHQRTNDSLDYIIKVKSLEELSNLKVTVQVPDSLTQYLLQLEDSGGKVVKEELLMGGGEYVLDFRSLDPLDYNLRIIADTTPNGKWDAVDFTLSRHPEPVLVKKIGKLLPNFDREEEWIVNFEN